MAVKGVTNNPAGRPKGTPNKMTKELRTTLKNILDKEFEQLPMLLAQLEPNDRITAIIKLLAYVLPRIENVKMAHDEPHNFDFIDI